MFNIEVFFYESAQFIGHTFCVLRSYPKRDDRSRTLTMTIRYAHLAPGHKVKAVDILDNAINKADSEVSQRMSTIRKLYIPPSLKEKEASYVS